MYILLDFSCNEVTENQEPNLYIFQKLIINRNVSIGSNFSHPLHWVVPFFFFDEKIKKMGCAFSLGWNQNTWVHWKIELITTHA